MTSITTSAFRRASAALLTLVCILSVPPRIAGQSGTTADTTVLGALKAEALALRPMVKSDIAVRFLQAVPELPSVTPRVIYVKKATAEYLSQAAYEARPDSAREGFERRDLGEQFYYYTRYGTPLAFVRAFDLVGQQGFTALDGARIIDFGCGTVGQLRLMASLGAEATGIEVDPVLKLLYTALTDTGSIPRSAIAGQGTNGKVNMLFGNFPTDTAVTNHLPGQYDLFFSKNTLKRGYVHPEREVDPRMLVHLGVDDSTFVRTVYSLLKPGGYFMIYNLHPKRSTPEDEKYIPWSDGRSPFDRETYETAGFTVLQFDTDDTEFARNMGLALGWEQSMKVDTNLFGTCTLARK